MKEKKTELSEEDKQKMLKKISDRYEHQTEPYYAASRLWVDAIIDPADTRKWISLGIEAANHAPVEKEYSTGVLQV
jgi:acetyl-CoA carboxylase carboxyltransferase component